MLTLEEFKKKYDNTDFKGLDEYQIADDILDKNAKGDAYFEALAFEFGGYPDGSGWGQFYGYLNAIVLESGQELSNIRKEDITGDALNYWQERTSTAKKYSI